MAFTATTLSAAVGVNDTTILVASLTGFAAGYYVRIDGELMKVVSVPSAATIPVPVLRGQDGTAQRAHASSAAVIVGAGPSASGSDWQQAPAGAAQLTTIPTVPAINRLSFAASGAITLPSVGAPITIVHLLGTNALAMTLATPSAAQDGDILIVVANGKAAHTLTVSGGIGAGGASFDVGTFSASLQGGCILIAAGGVWTMVGNGVAGATAATGAPLWA